MLTVGIDWAQTHPHRFVILTGDGECVKQGTIQRSVDGACALIGGYRGWTTRQRISYSMTVDTHRVGICGPKPKATFTVVDTNRGPRQKPGAVGNCERSGISRHALRRLSGNISIYEAVSASC